MNTPTNFNQSSPNPTPDFGAPQNKDNSKQIITAMGIALALLLGLSIWLLWSKSQTSQQLEATGIELSEQKQAFADLDVQFNEAKTQLEEQKGINAELDAKINEQLQQLEEKKGQIAGLIRENKNYRGAMADFQAQKTAWLTEIDDLKRQMGVLTEQNAALSTSLTETSTRLEEETSAKAALISEKTQLETERVELTKKVDIASAVKVKNVTVKPVDLKKSGKEKEKNKAKNVERLNICFLTEANEVVPAGEETFYLTILDPTGSTLAIEDLGSGVAKEKKTDSEFRYTVSQSVSYDNTETNVCAAWQPGQNFAKGKYTIQIYNKGYLVGTSSFNLK
ncbi:MAG: hypothetical protein ACOYNO_11875 [Saprospiraceae bacterium]